MSEQRTPAAEHPSDSPADAALGALLDRSTTAAPDELAGLVDACARSLGARGAVSYLADLQQHVLMPFVAPRGPGDDVQRTPLRVDSTLAGRAFQDYAVYVQDAGVEGLRAWFPLLVGTDRLGVLGVTVDSAEELDADDGRLRSQLARLASTAASLLMSKQPYGDTIVTLRRRSQMGLAAEIQWSLLPPLTFASAPVTIAAALEPCYAVAGDTIDYAVDAGVTRFAVFDGMGHGLHSSLCAVLTMGAYRSARRIGRSLVRTLSDIDDALREGLGGEAFTTGVLAELDTTTGVLEWVNAGHPEPLLLRGGRMVKSLALTPRPPLGLGELEGADPALVGREQLEPGDYVLMFTDGVVEARSPAGEFFGIERLSDLLVRHLAGGLPAPETMRRVVRELLDHQQDQLSDDASLLIVQWRSGTEHVLRV